VIRGELGAIAERLGAEQHGTGGSFAGVAIDTRRLVPGALFVALPGSRVDGHAFLADARAAGAAGAVVMRLDPTVDLPQLVVPDGHSALVTLALDWRAAFKGPVVALTGSNGKTTVKEMVASILGVQGEVWATPGNYNNALGVPLSLLGLDPQRHVAAVFELGANHAGEIAQLTEWVRPDVGLITQAGRAHLEGFGSLEGVARAKGELIAGLSAQGVAVINGDDRFAAYWAGLAKGRVVYFGLAPEAAVRTDPAACRVVIDAASLSQAFTLVTPTGEAPVRLGFPGRHNVRNALAAAAVGEALGLPIETIATGLRAARPAPGRLNWLIGSDGVRVIDDTYNANPTSMAAAIDVLAEMTGERWLVMGDMGELGAEAAALHGEMGARARAQGIDRLYALGSLSAAAIDAFGGGGRHFADQDELIACLSQELKRSAATLTLLVKGSRYMAMERVVAALRQED
jgi:UDP-N-acetylmuramoyl-tripeptide--D-alanyl-D-alanine ligase